MRIASVGGSGSVPVNRHMEADAHQPDAAEEPRALIAVQAATASEQTPRVTRHPGAAFLTQLIATQMRAPQTRARRRAEPDEAIAVYRSMTKPVAQRRAFGKRA